MALDGAERRVALTVADGDGTDVWVVDLASGGMSRLTFDGRSGYPIWAADGESLIYSSLEGEVVRLLARRVDGQSSAREAVAPGTLCFARRVTPDGRLFYLRQDSATSRWSLWSVPLDGRGDGGGGGPEPTVVFAPEERVRSMAVSIDGSWLAYEARTEAVWEIRLRRLDQGGGGPWQLSSGGGSEPRWHADGHLYYRVGEGLTRVDVKGGEALEAVNRSPILSLDGALSYLPPAAGEQVLVQRAFSPRSRSLGLVLGWKAEVERLLRPIPP